MKHHARFGWFMFGMADEVPPDGGTIRVRLVTKLAKECRIVRSASMIRCRGGCVRKTKGGDVRSKGVTKSECRVAWRPRSRIKGSLAMQRQRAARSRTERECNEVKARFVTKLNSRVGRTPSCDGLRVGLRDTRTCPQCCSRFAIERSLQPRSTAAVNGQLHRLSVILASTLIVHRTSKVAKLWC
jgi:hypothetical protein